MKGVTVFCFFAILAFAAAQGKYTNRYDNIDVQEIIDNRRLLLAYIQCALDKGKCTPEGRELKSHIKEALETRCAKCTEVQRNWTRLVLRHLINHEQGFWNELSAKYDPESKYKAMYENELKSIQA